MTMQSHLETLTRRGIAIGSRKVAESIRRIPLSRILEVLVFPRASPNSQLFLRKQAIFRLSSLFLRPRRKNRRRLWRSQAHQPARTWQCLWPGHPTRIAIIRKERG